MNPTFFPTPADFRQWLAEANSASARELLVGFYKKDTGRPSITWPESVDEALCFGWIDGIRKSLGEDQLHASASRRANRRASGAWPVNIKRVAVLTDAGVACGPRA